MEGPAGEVAAFLLFAWVTSSQLAPCSISFLSVSLATWWMLFLHRNQRPELALTTDLRSFGRPRRPCRAALFLVIPQQPLSSDAERGQFVFLLKCVLLFSILDFWGLIVV